MLARLSLSISRIPCPSVHASELIIYKSKVFFFDVFGSYSAVNPNIHTVTCYVLLLVHKHYSIPFLKIEMEIDLSVRASVKALRCARAL